MGERTRAEALAEALMAMKAANDKFAKSMEAIAEMCSDCEENFRRMRAKFDSLSLPEVKSEPPAPCCSLCGWVTPVGVVTCDDPACGCHASPAVCRGCGGDTREFKAPGLGWMHYKCEINRLTSLLAEARDIQETTEDELHNAEYLASLACKNPPPGCTCGGCWLAKKRAELAVKGEDDE